MITLINDKDKLDMGVKGHQHKNKELIDSIKNISGKYYIDKNVIRLFKEGAVIKDAKEVFDEDGYSFLRLYLDGDIFDTAFIDLTTSYTYSKYDEDTDTFGLCVDFGMNEYKPMAQVAAKSSGSRLPSIFPNVYYTFGAVDILHADLVKGTDEFVNFYSFSFEASDTTIFTMPEDVVWGNDNEIVIEGGKRYEVCVLNGVALWNAATLAEVAAE